MIVLRKLGVGLLLALAIPAWSDEIAVLQNGFSIRHQRREQIGLMTRLYVSPPGTGYMDVLTTQIDHFDKDESLPNPTAASVPAVQGLAKASLQGALSIPAPATKTIPGSDFVADAGELHHVDPDLIRSVIRAESGFNVRAVSPKGARGLMQLMPQTASVLGVNNSFDPAANVEGGTRYLRMLLERYNFDLVKALAAYNAGPQRVEQYGGVPPYYETRAYVARIIRDFNRKKLAEQKAAAVAAAATKAKTAKTVSRKPAPAAASKAPASSKVSPPTALGPLASR